MELKVWLKAQWDRVTGVTLIVLGGVLLLVGYWGVSGSEFVAEQLSYIASGGLAGVSLVAIGVGLLISADLHDEWRKLDRIEAAILGQSAAEIVVPDASPSSEESNGDGAAAAPYAARTGASGTRQPTMVGNRVAVASGPSTWALPTRFAGTALMVVVVSLATAMTVAGWFRTSGTSDVDRAVSGLGIGGLGICAALVAAGGYGVSLRRRVMARRGRLLDPWLLSSVLAEKRLQWCGNAKPESSPSGSFVFIVDGQARYHIEGCPFLAGRSSQRVARSQVDPRLDPCAHCGA